MEISTLMLAGAGALAAVTAVGTIGLLQYEERQRPRRLVSILRDPRSVRGLVYRFSRADGQLKLYAVFSDGRKKAVANWAETPAALAQLGHLGLR